MVSPLILTLILDAPSQRRFDAIRDDHFPASRNYLRAHVTLFHALPDEVRKDLEACLVREVSSSRPMIRVTDVRTLGHGVAYFFTSPELSELRFRLAKKFVTHLTAQDSQPFRPHVTVQNKVSPASAKATLEKLALRFAPFDCYGDALMLWRYAGGPWDALKRFEFDPMASNDQATLG